MNPDSNPVSKCIRSEATTEDEKENGTDDIAGSVPDASQEANSEDVTDAFANVFTEDILPDIFDNLRILTAKDLLHFRLVNRCWRDAATSVLLKRNIFRIPLYFGVITNVESGIFDENKFNFVKELIRCSPNLIAIQDIATSSLGDLVEMGKCHLVKGTCFGLLYLTPPLKKLVTDTILKGSLPNVPTLQLSKLTVDFIEWLGVSNTNDVMINGLNLILSASKTSLKHLELLMTGTDHLVNIFIPPLPRLIVLEFDCFKTSSNIRFHFVGDVLGQALQAGELAADGPIDDFSELIRRNQGNNNIPADYFPRLREVKVISRSFVFTQAGKFAEFFSLEHLEADGVTTVPGDTLPIVTSLELGQFPRDGGNMSQLFPNVSHLKISLMSLECLLNQNWVWSVFPQLQRFELVCFMVQESGWSMADVDSFFTGFSKEICAKIETSVTTTECELDVGPGAVFERTQPYIGDCKNLKEFKFTFLFKLCDKFASKITAIHGFQHVIHRTKILFSFACRQNVEEMEETRLNLEPVAAYVDIRMRE